MILKNSFFTKNKFLFIFLILGLFLISFTSAIDSHKQNTEYDLIISSNNASSCNLTYIKYPDSSKLIYSIPLTQSGRNFYTTIKESNYSQLGLTCMGITCTDGITFEQGSKCIEVTPNGELPTIEKTIIYLSLDAILFIILLTLLFFIFSTENFSWRVGLSAFSYVISNVFLLVSWKIAELFLTSVPFIETIFRILYISSNVIYLPFFLGIVVVYLLHMTNEKNIKTLMNRGFTEDQARWREGKNR